ncbi:MAG: hypothetical protein WC817_03855 [Patescibacteria group bacterium]|jgi:hypothetical protein
MATLRQRFWRWRYFGRGQEIVVDGRLTIEQLIGNEGGFIDGEPIRRGVRCLLPVNLRMAGFSSLGELGRKDGTVRTIRAFVDSRGRGAPCDNLTLARCGLRSANAADLFAFVRRYPPVFTYQRWHLMELGEFGLSALPERPLSVEGVVLCVRPQSGGQLIVELRRAPDPDDPSNDDLAYLLVAD